MIIYYMNLLSVFLYGFLYELHRTRRSKKLICILITIQLILLTGLRKYTVGIDTPQYYSLFSTLNLHGVEAFWSRSQDKFMIVYKAVNYLIWKCGGSFQLLLIIMAAIAIIPVMYYIYTNSGNMFLSIFIYLSFNFYMYTFITLRQSAAYGIILLSIPAIYNRNLKKFLLLIAIAIGFHISALFFFPAYWLYKIKMNKITVLGFIILGIFIWSFRLPLMNILINTMFTDYEVMVSSSVNYMIIHIVIIVFALIIRAIRKKGQYKAEELVDMAYVRFWTYKDDFILTLMMFGTVLMIFCTVSSNALRITYFYTIQLIVFLPNTIKRLGNTKLIFLVEITSFIVCIYIFFRFLDGFSLQNMEYIPFWK
ncbi:MAG: EpsG family protein [Clostridiales bacterium]|nr:EpsG family protein [Clostridiales bacterium]